MIRPYLAVIRDSFHEALVSRVLWILLIVTTIVLALISPISIVEQAGSYLNDEDLIDQEQLVKSIVAAGKADAPSPGKHIWESLSPEERAMLENDPAEQSARRANSMNLVAALREQLAGRNFFDEASWAKTQLSAEAYGLKKKGINTLGEQELARFNRLALQAAFPKEIAPAPPKQVQLGYFRWELGIPLPFEPEQLYPAINQFLVAILGILLGGAGVFVAVLVTASMIPQAFEAGSVDLLLSKPVNRSWLFLSKFVGGCAFIAINAAYFIVGLWLILGLRLGLWNQRLLWAIPLYLFLFAIYYGVSSLAGLIWRNAIVSVVVAVVFWLLCFSIGIAVGLVEQISLNPRRLVKIVPAGEALLAVNPSETFAWDKERGDWRRVFVGRGDGQVPFVFGSQLVGPVFDATSGQLLAFQKPIPGFTPFGSVNRLFVATADDDWRRKEGVRVPDGTAGLFVDRSGILIAAASGIYRLVGDPAAAQQSLKILGREIPVPQDKTGFQPAGERLSLRPLVSTAHDAATGAIVLFDGSKLVLCKPDDSKPDSRGAYQQAGEVAFERKQAGQVAAGGGRVYLATSGGDVLVYDDALKPQETLSTGITSLPDAMRMSDDGRYLAIVYKNARLWLYDTKESDTPFRVAGQGDISAAAFAGEKLLVADRLTRVIEYDLADGRRVRQWQGSMPLAEKIYRYFLNPLYTVFPKPGELNTTVNHILTEPDAKVAGVRLDENQEGIPQSVDVWGPVWSNLAFLVVVLGISCVYVARRDF